jgi:hypothetical protein
MPNPLRISYSAASTESEASSLPFLPITLTMAGQTIKASGLVDSGATINVLPYALGLELGAVWDSDAAVLRLSGNLAQFPARPLIVSAVVGTFAPVRLAFAWTQAEHVPLLLGQVNFLKEFDICFFGSQRFFEVQSK